MICIRCNKSNKPKIEKKNFCVTSPLVGNFVPFFVNSLSKCSVLYSGHSVLWWHTIFRTEPSFTGHFDLNEEWLILEIFQTSGMVFFTGPVTYLPMMFDGQTNLQKDYKIVFIPRHTKWRGVLWYPLKICVSFCLSVPWQFPNNNFLDIEGSVTNLVYLLSIMKCRSRSNLHS